MLVALAEYLQIFILCAHRAFETFRFGIDDSTCVKKLIGVASKNENGLVAKCRHQRSFSRCKVRDDEGGPLMCHRVILLIILDLDR